MQGVSLCQVQHVLPALHSIRVRMWHKAMDSATAAQRRGSTTAATRVRVYAATTCALYAVHRISTTRNVSSNYYLIAQDRRVL